MNKADKKGGKGAGKATKKEGPAFVLPSSLPECSELFFPVLIEKKSTVKWNDILEESRALQEEIAEFDLAKKKVEPETKSLFMKTECDYISYSVFGLLIPALEETLRKAKIWEVLITQKCFFNGIDHISQIIWNNNPRHPHRQFLNYHIFNMPWVREHLERHPRPYYPKSWLWPQEYAATVIQKTVRQYFVQREEEVQEMRDFWRKLAMEKESPDLAKHLENNLFLSRKFASDRSVSRAHRH